MKSSVAEASGTKRKRKMPAWVKILEAARGPTAQALTKRVKALLGRGGLDSDVKELVAKALLPEENKRIKFKSAAIREAAPSAGRTSGRRKPQWQKELEAAMGMVLTPGRRGRKAETEDGVAKRSSGRHRPKWLEAMVGQNGFKAAEAIWRKQVRTAQEESLIRTKKEEAEARSKGLPVVRKSRSGKRKKLPKVPLTPSERKKRKLVKAIARRANCWLGRRLPPVVRPGKRRAGMRRPGTGREDVAKVDEAPSEKPAEEAPPQAPAAPAEAAAVAPKRKIRKLAEACGGDSSGRKAAIKAIARRANTLLGRSRPSGGMAPGEDEEDQEGPSTS